VIAHRPRLSGDIMLGTRRAAAVLDHRHPDLVRRRCQPVACDRESRALLYDLDEVAATFAPSVTARRLTSRAS
jgi:hypothetical protein